MSYTDLRDFCPEAIFPAGPFGREIPTLTMEIEKLGGGTLGKLYSGRWRWQLRVDDVVTEYGQELNPPAMGSHLDAAKYLAIQLVHDAERFPDNGPLSICGRLKEWLSQFS